MTRLSRESGAQRDGNAATGRVWHIVNPEKTNALGKPVGYVLHPQNSPTLLADDESVIRDGRLHRFHPEARRVLRPQPGARRAAYREHALSRLRITATSHP